MSELTDLSELRQSQPKSVIALLLDRTTLVVLLSALLLLISFYHRGDFAWLPDWARTTRLGWFGLNFMLLFVAPALFTRFILRRPLAEIGVRFGDWHLSLRFAAIYGAITIPTILIASRWGDFQGYYGHYSGGQSELAMLLIAQAGWLVYFFAWEFFFRGFLLFNLGERFGALAIPLQTVPFVMMHFSKPEAESVAAIIAGIALGWWAWRTRSFVGPWLLHWLCSATMIMAVAYWHS